MGLGVGQVTCCPSLEQNSLETQRGRELALSPVLQSQEASQKRHMWGYRRDSADDA